MPNDEGGKNKLSRREEFEKQDFEIAVPECDAQYVIKHLLDIGITLGDHATTHAEIESYQHNIGICLNPWEVLTIKRLSETYLNESYKARELNAETPWQDAPYYMTRSYRSAMRAKASIRNMAKN
ncbi:MAG: hypothetical protein JSR71_09385 [Proteobacteria bacterium]|nr:hypothetical protein [Pseudomonadota bacterium]